MLTITQKQGIVQEKQKGENIKSQNSGPVVIANIDRSIDAKNNNANVVLLQKKCKTMKIMSWKTQFSAVAPLINVHENPYVMVYMYCYTYVSNSCVLYKQYKQGNFWLKCTETISVQQF